MGKTYKRNYFLHASYNFNDAKEIIEQHLILRPNILYNPICCAQFKRKSPFKSALFGPIYQKLAVAIKIQYHLNIPTVRITIFKIRNYVLHTIISIHSLKLFFNWKCSSVDYELYSYLPGWWFKS